jgi:hypothetical protein
MGGAEPVYRGWLVDVWDGTRKIGQARIVRYDGDLLVGDDGRTYTRRALVAGAGVVEVETPEGH